MRSRPFCSLMRVASTLAVLSGLCLTGHGYVLHESCDPYRNMLIEVMGSAFDLAQAGSDVFTHPPDPNSGPTGKAQTDLVSYLFAETMTNGNIDTSNGKWNNASRVFTSVLNYNRRNNGQPDATPASYMHLPSDRVVLFCDFDRFREDQDCEGNSRPGWVCDKALEVFYYLNDKYFACKRRRKMPWEDVIEALAFEFASSFGMQRPSMIQLCPDYLEEMEKATVRTLRAQGDEKASSKIKSFWKDPFRTPMDLKYTFDATLLHEMTHAISTWTTVDVRGSDSYGWKNCRKMSNDKSTENAESYALFGLSALMMSEKGSRPMEDGSYKALTSAARRKRDSHDAHAPLDYRAVDPENASTGNPEGSGTSPSSVTNSSFGASSVSKTFSYRPSSLRTSARGPMSSSPRLPLPLFGTESQSFSGFSSSRSRPSSSFIATTVNPGNATTTPSFPSPLSTPPSPGSSSGSPSSDSVPRSSVSTTVNSGPAASDPSSSVSPSGSPSSDSATHGNTRNTLETETSVSPSDLPSSGSVTHGTTGNTLETVTSGSSTSTLPATVISVSKSGTTTHVSYTPTYTSNDEIKPTWAWMCVGPLCDTGSDCVVPLFCDSLGGGGKSWGLCCGWKPPSPPGGGPPPPGGPSPGPPVPDPTPDPPDNNDPSNSPEKTLSSTETQSSESSSSDTSTTTSTTTSSASTFSTTSSISTSSISTPSISTPSISRSSSSPSSTTTQQAVMVTPIADSFNAWDPDGASWYDIQQSVLLRAMGATTLPYVISTPTASSSGSKMTPPTSPIAPAPSSSKATASTMRPPVSSGASMSASPPTSPSSPAPSSSEATASTMRTSASSGSKSASPPIMTTTASPTRNYPCHHRGGPDYTTGWCACETTVSGGVYHATAAATMGNCDMYTAFPSEITPITTTTTGDPVWAEPVPTPITITHGDGEVNAYPSRVVNTYRVYGTVSRTATEGAGQVTTLVPPAPTEISGNNDGSGMCESTGHACERAYKKFEDDRLYTEYAGYAANVGGFLNTATFGMARCIAFFECDDYGLGMTGEQIKNAVENLREEHDVDKCGTTYLSNTCHITLNYCIDCDDDH